MKKASESMNKEDREYVYRKTLEWLFTSHEAYNSALEWRKKLIEFLRETLEIDD